MNKHSHLMAGTAVILALSSLPTLADEPALSPYAAQISAGYIERTTHASGTGNPDSSIGSNAMAADAALLYRLDQNMNLQIDYAYRMNEFENDYEFDIWHVGGAVFHRDSNYLMGLAALSGEIASDGNAYVAHYIVGPMLESYQDNVTIGAKANYMYLDWDEGPGMKSGEINLYGKIYPASNVALKLSASYAHAEVDVANWDTYGIHGEAEYAVISNASVFARAQYANSTNQDDLELEDTQAMFGLRLYLNSDDSSIMNLHRSTTIDNINDLLENSTFGG